MKNLLPIRKVFAGLLASLLILGLRQAGITLGSDDADNYANALVGFVVSYLVPDPRVQKVVHKLGLREKLRLLNVLILRAQDQESAKNSLDEAAKASPPIHNTYPNPPLVTPSGIDGGVTNV